MDVSLKLDEQEISNLHILVKSFRERVQEHSKTEEDEALDAMLRGTELKLAGALRSVGWTPRPEGGWEQNGRSRGRRF